MLYDGNAARGTTQLEEQKTKRLAEPSPGRAALTTMTLIEQAHLRADQAFLLACAPARWIVSEAAVAELRAAGAGETLAGIPVEIGQLRSEWGLDLQVER